MLQVKHLSKSYSSGDQIYPVLKDVSLEVGKGEFVAVMGPSGSGKTTLLNCISQFIPHEQGEILLADSDISNLNGEELAEVRNRRMGFVFQQMNMVANLNILDNILLPAVQAEKGRGRQSGDRLAEKAAKLMRRLSISGLEDRRITQVSGGQLQRACICRSMMNAPEILFADEPTGALNRSAAEEVMTELVKLNREGTTILMVTHDSRVAGRCDRILYLLDGRICGELICGRSGKETEREREERVNRWLMEMGW